MAHHDAILALEPAVMEEMIARSCEIKREVVEHDPTEKGERALLNFGHTIGHAIEKLCGFSLYHGEMWGLGILAAAYLSKKAGKSDRGAACRYQAVPVCLLDFRHRSMESQRMLCFLPPNPIRK